MRNLKTAILCASGIGDGLLMMIAGHHLQEAGKDVTIFHSKAPALAPLFPHATFKLYPNNYDFLTDFDRVFVQNDNSKLVWDLMRLREAGSLNNLVVIHPKSCRLATSRDYTFDPRNTFAGNMARICKEYLFMRYPSKANGLILPEGLETGIHFERVIIHPTSADPLRNWSASKYISLAQRVASMGFDPIFVMSESEKESWDCNDFEVKTFNSLLDLAGFMHESGYFIGNDSGPGHLASNVGLPTLTISGNPKHVRIWRPNWSHGLVTTLKHPLPNFKGLGWPYRDQNWQKHVPIRRVMRHFKRLIHG